MTFSYEVVQTQYGLKLCIFWDDPDDYPDGIKDLDWDTTHRSMYNPEWDDAHDKIVHEKVDETCWYIDCTPQSVAMFEDRFNVYVPSKHRPDEPDGDKVEIVVPEEYSKFFVQAPPREVDKILDSEFSYEAPNAEYTRAYKSGEWDGIVRIYNKPNHSAPIGLLPRATDTLEREGYTVDVEWEDRSSNADPIDTTWNDDYELRNYQAEATIRVSKNEGGIIGAATGSGKTVMALKIIHQNRLTRGRAIVLVHTQELLYQWAEEVEELLGVEPGIIGDGEWSEGPITIASMQTLHSRGTSQLEHDYGQVFFDECHRTSAAETFHEVGMDLGCQYRVGLSATPWRRVSGEELYIEGAVGDVVFDVSAEEMIDKGYLAKPEFSNIDPRDFGHQATADYSEDYHEAYRRVIEFEPTRNLAIATHAAALAEQGHKVLVNVNRILQGRLITAALRGDLDESYVTDPADGDVKRNAALQCFNATGTVADTNARMLSSNTSDRQDVIDEFEDGDLDIIVSTVLKEGVDIPDMTAVILAHGGKSDVEVIQTVGRALRPKNGENAQIVDVKDRGHFFGDAFDKRQSTMAEYYGDYFNLEDPEYVEETGPGEQIDLTEPLTDEEYDDMEDWIDGMGQ